MRDCSIPLCEVSNLALECSTHAKTHAHVTHDYCSSPWQQHCIMHAVSLPCRVSAALCSKPVQNSLIAMPSCSYCNFNSSNREDFLKHVRFHKHEPNFLIYCSFPGCGRSFTKINSLQKRFSRDHIQNEDNEITDRRSR